MSSSNKFIYAILFVAALCYNHMCVAAENEQCKATWTVEGKKMELLNSYFLFSGFPAFFEYKQGTICYSDNVFRMETTYNELKRILARVQI